MFQPGQDVTNLSKTMFIVLAITLLASAFSAAPIKAEPVETLETCPARPQGNKITRMVMTLAAAKYCKDFPATTTDVEAALNKMGCNERSQNAIRNIKLTMMPKMQALYEGNHADMMCAQAAKYFQP